MTLVPFGEWRPDQSDLNSDAVADILNVLPAARSYIAAQKFVALATEAIPADALGGITAFELNGTSHIFIGTATKIYKLDPSDLTWADVSKTATTYGASKEAPWSFAQFGTYVIAVNPNDDPQYFELGSSTLFDDLPGNPPRAGVVKIWGDFVALMNLTSDLDRVHWSGLNDAEEWTPGNNSCDFQIFPSGGVVQGSSEATNPIIVQQKAIHLGTFLPGSLEIFRFVKIHDLIGAKSSLSVATRGAVMFFIDEGAFMQISPDGAIANIGAEKVNTTVFEAISAVDISAMRGVVDPFYSRVYWSADVGGVGYFNRLFVYDWSLGKWSPIEVAIQMHMTAATPGQTLDGLDAAFPNLDLMTTPLDSKIFQGGAPVIAAISRDRILGTFTGEEMEATLTLQEMGGTNGEMTRITEVTGIIDTLQYWMSIGTRNRRSDPFVWTAEQRPSSNTGIVRKVARGRFHRIKFRVAEAAGWRHAQGADVKSAPTGFR